MWESQIIPRLRCQTQSRYVQTAPIRKVLMSKPSQVENAYVQTVPDWKCICTDHRAFKINCAIFRAFNVEYVQAIPHQKRICSDFFLCRRSCTPKNSSFQHQSFIAFIFRLSCVHDHTFARSPDRKNEKKVKFKVLFYSVKELHKPNETSRIFSLEKKDRYL